jgi:hypothetical protein
MTALLDSAALDQADDTGTTPVRLLRGEFMKIRTTDTGWLPHRFHRVHGAGADN